MGARTVFLAGTAYLGWYKLTVLLKVRSTPGLPGNTSAEATLVKDGGGFQPRL